MVHAKKLRSPIFFHSATALFLSLAFYGWILSAGAVADAPVRPEKPTAPLHERRELPRPPMPGLDYARDELIVVRRDRIEKVKVAADELWSRSFELRRQRDVEAVELNFFAETQGFSPNDPYYPYQWNFELIDLLKAWDSATGEGVVVAVVDSGVTQVGDLAKTNFVPGYDFVDNDGDPHDANGHGTHVAGTIAQSTNNSYGTAGAAFESTLMPVRVLDRSGRGSYYNIYRGILWAVDHGADVINLSLGGAQPSSLLERAVEYAYDRGVPVVAASGNNGSTGSNGVIYPAAYDQFAIAVGAVRYDKKRVNYSNGGNALDFVAPGGDMGVDQNGDGYGDGILQETINGFYFYQGTSMATAHVSGLVALLKEIGGSLSPDEVEQRLMDASEDLGSSGWDRQYGHGLVNAGVLITGEGSTPDPTPTFTPSPTEGPSPTTVPTQTPTPTLTPTPTSVPTATPTSGQATPTLTPSPTPSDDLPDWLKSICARYPFLRRCR